jgi:chromatin remodeling complex protein RSC6
MHKEAGSEIARTEATRALVSYIKEHKLENASNSKKIVPDATLKQLLGIGDGDEVELNYFNIQQHMNKHFIKTH